MSRFARQLGRGTPTPPVCDELPAGWFQAADRPWLGADHVEHYCAACRDGAIGELLEIAR